MNHLSSGKTRDDARAIWNAGVDAVRSEELVASNLCLVNQGQQLTCKETSICLTDVDRILVVGAGKAGTGMVSGVKRCFAGSRWDTASRLVGWVNVPDDCLPDVCLPDDHGPGLASIHLHPARPAGCNEPTETGVYGANKILELVRSATPRDLVLGIISGGGSALLPCPVSEVTWQEKRTITQLLSAAGASIRQLNTVRKQLSAIKGGRLARACSHAPMLNLILSDVIGDPLDVIASGPTVADSTNANDALDVLTQFLPDTNQIPLAVQRYLKNQSAKQALPAGTVVQQDTFSQVTNIVLGNNQTAVDAAHRFANKLGFRVVILPTQTNEGTAEHVAQNLLNAAKNEPVGTCILSGGEPTVELTAPSQRGKGGRNQQLVLAAVIACLEELPRLDGSSDCERTITLLSGGTDGEDGPTDAAGAIMDATLLEHVRSSNEDPQEYLRRNDSYTFMSKFNALVHTGPTHTNVCDLRVLIVG